MTMENENIPMEPEAPMEIAEQPTTDHAKAPEPNAEQHKPAGTLFESIAYNKPEDIARFVDTMSVNDAALILLTQATYSHKKGVFNLLESEVVSKAIRVFTAPRQPVNPPEEKIEQPKIY